MPPLILPWPLTSNAFIILGEASSLVNGYLQAPLILSYLVLTIICCLKEPYA